MTIREQILTAIAAAFEPIQNVGVYRSREAAFARTEGVGLLIRPEEELVENRALSLAFRNFRVLVTVIARGQIPDQVADFAIDAMHTAIMVDPTLGGLCRSIIEEETKWDFEVADQNAVAAVARYRIVYATSTSTLSSVT